jgi:hypothetical protein
MIGNSRLERSRIATRRQTQYAGKIAAIFVIILLPWYLGERILFRGHDSAKKLVTE